MPKGFDTPADCAAKANEIKAAGYDFVGRYLSSHSWKVISPAEAVALRHAGLAIVLAYEDGPTATDYFSFSRGQTDGTRALQQAQGLGAPANTAIYFAVDYDATSDDIAGAITQYFRGVAGSFANFAASNDLPYRVGIYGSGATCDAMVKAGLANLSWLACASGWSGHDYLGWVISQSLPTVISGLSVDPDNARGDYGAMPPL